MQTDFISEIQQDILFYLELLKEANKESIMKGFVERYAECEYRRITEWAIDKVRINMDILRRNEK